MLLLTGRPTWAWPRNAGCQVATVTFDRASELLAYNPVTGWLTWKVYKSSRSAIGSRAGYVSTVDGYRRVQIDGKMFLEHIVIWLLVYGKIPNHQVDHENRVRDDNREENLRPATPAQNHINSKMRCDNTTGQRGVTRHKQAGKYYARLYIDGRQTSLGLYDSAKEAGEVARLARLKAYGPYAPSYDQHGA